MVGGYQPKKCGLLALGHQPVGKADDVRGAPWDQRGLSWVTPKESKVSKKKRKTTEAAKTKPEFDFKFPKGAGPMCYTCLGKLHAPGGAGATRVPHRYLDYARRAYIKKYCMKDEPTQNQKSEGYFSKDNLPQTVFDCPDGKGGAAVYPRQLL